MDAALALTGLIQEFNLLLGAQDFEGAEELAAGALGRDRRSDSYLHYYLGRMYAQWNKLTSAVNHLTQAAELAKSGGDDLFLLQVVEELKLAKQRQLTQRP